MVYCIKLNVQSETVAFLSAFAEYHGFLICGCPPKADPPLAEMRIKKPWYYGGFRRSAMSADNPDEYGEIIEENFAISYESG